MSAMIAHPELLPDHLDDSRRGPDFSAKTESRRTSSQQSRQLRHLFGTQLRLSARWGLMPQGTHSLCSDFRATTGSLLPR